MQNLAELFDLEAPTEPRLVERTSEPSGAVREVFEVDGELVEVESWSAEWEREEVTVEIQRG